LLCIAIASSSGADANACGTVDGPADDVPGAAPVGSSPGPHPETIHPASKIIAARTRIDDNTAALSGAALLVYEFDATVRQLLLPKAVQVRRSRCPHDADPAIGDSVLAAETLDTQKHSPVQPAGFRAPAAELHRPGQQHRR
jgi:hypothetical protein